MIISIRNKRILLTFLIIIISSFVHDFLIRIEIIFLILVLLKLLLYKRNNLSKIPTRNITTKEELKRFLWILHNRVNKQLHKPQLSYEACNRFKYARTGRMVEYFKYNMLRYSGQLRMAITNRNKNMH